MRERTREPVCHHAIRDDGFGSRPSQAGLETLTQGAIFKNIPPNAAKDWVGRRFGESSNENHALGRHRPRKPVCCIRGHG
ncbi:MAG: hypothetical protein L0H29_05850, partial [Sinobacteraceae bacterium]|nr:hypothetical protein [Nevskiaceae bacterium]